MNDSLSTKSSRASLGPLLLITLAALIPVALRAQIEMGGVTGTVKDQTGAVVPSAQCTLTNTGTNVALTAASTSAGAYTFSAVPAGTYSLKVVAKGFKEYVLEGIEVHLGSVATEDVALQVGSTTTEVTVTSAPPLLQAQDASLGMIVDNTAATELPIFGTSGGRNFEALLNTAPGVQYSNNANNSTNTYFVNGANNSQVDVRLNGADDNAEVFGGISIPPIPDAIQEFKLQSGDNPAELGHSYGPVVNVVTQSGTNQYRGAVWEYNENDMFNANDYFNKLHQLVTNSVHTPNRPGKYKENSYGGMFGGPVRLPGYRGRNRTFFFVDFQRTDYTQSQLYPAQTVPTNAMQSSGFTNLSDTLTLNYQTSAANASKSEKTDGLGRVFQLGTMLDPATTRAVPCGGTDPVTGLAATCPSGSNPTKINGVQTAIIRDPYFGNAPAGCPSITSMNFNSTYNQGPVSPSCLNQIPAGRLDPNAVALLSLFPKPNQPSATSLSYANNYSSLVSQPTTTMQYDIRVDHKISDKDSVFGTFSHYNQTTPGAAPFPGFLEGGTSGSNFATTTPTYMVVATETHDFSPNLMNTFRFAVEHTYNTRTDVNGIDNQLGIPGQFGIAGIPQSAGNGGLPDFNVNSSISSFGSRSNITYQTVGAWEYFDSVTKIVGKHEWKLGGQWDWTYGQIAQLPSSRGSFTYNGVYSDVPFSGDSNTGIADFLLVPAVASGAYAAAGNALSVTGNVIGGANQYSGNNFATSTYRAPYLAFFAEDHWKITPNFTADLGLRYDYFGPYYSDGGQEASLWMGGDGNSASGAAYYIGHDGCATSMSQYFRSLLAYDNIPIICQPNNAINKMPKANWAPRIGFAYRIRPNLVVRMGGGVAYGAFGSVGYGGTPGTNYPFRFNVNNPSGNNAYTPQKLPDNVTTATMENIFGAIDMTNPLNASQPLGSVVLTGKQYNYKVPRFTTLDFALQWQFTAHDSIQGVFVGTLGNDLDSPGPYHNAVTELLTPSTNIVTLSPTAANPYAATGYVPFPNLSPNDGPTDFTNQVSNYQSGQVEYQHQFSAGFFTDANYTYSRCWSDTESQNNGAPGIRAPFVTGFGGIRNDYARCANEATHLFHFSGDVTPPVGNGQRFLSNAGALENGLVDGWHLTYLVVAQSGDLQNLNCFGTNGYGANPGFTGPWFASNTALQCFAPTVPDQHLYGPGSRDLAKTRITGYWNSSAFTAPQYPVLQNGQTDMSPLGVRGNQLNGPGFYDIDAALHKDFQIRENTKLEFQVQAINVLNHVQLNPPNSGTNSNANYTNPSGESLTGGFGTITGDRFNNGEGRILQFVGKLSF
jgi:hypothetical protein